MGNSQHSAWLCRIERSCAIIIPSQEGTRGMEWEYPGESFQTTSESLTWLFERRPFPKTGKGDFFKCETATQDFRNMRKIKETGHPKK
jgi:hypothetical protein